LRILVFVFAREALLEGLTILKNRGYDSAGIVTMHHSGGEPLVSETLSMIQRALLVVGTYLESSFFAFFSRTL
jgi:hypothetical protein